MPVTRSDKPEEAIKQIKIVELIAAAIRKRCGHNPVVRRLTR